MSTPHERRQFWRSAFQAPARVICNGREYPVQLHDVSLKGALVEHDGAWAAYAGQSCHLRLALGAGAVITMVSRVAHIEGHHIGLHCDSIDLDSITHLRQLVERNAQDATILDRDLVALVSRR